jgi:hypothetical protein
MHLFHDEDVEIFVNGKLLFEVKGFTTQYRNIELSKDQRALFREGKNTIAVHCSQTSGGQGIDVGLTLLKSE